MAVIWLSQAKFGASSSSTIYTTLKQQTANTGFKEQNSTVRQSVKQRRVKLAISATPEILVTALQIHHSTNLFSPYCLLLCFLLSSILHPLQYQTQCVLQCIPALSMLAQFMHVFIAGSISISKSLLCLLPFFSQHKNTTTEFDP